MRIVDGRPKVIADKPGVRFRPDDVERTFLRLLRKPVGKREGAVDARVARADFRTADARKLRIKEQVSQFTTYFPHAAYRNTNIGRAADLVDGTILEPGETFSLNGTVGERTRANGFTKGFIIEDGVYQEDLGGGVSQMATTTFNAMVFAGLEVVEHKPHSFYIDRYPVGREATVAWGSVDLRFRNDTPYGVLITAHVTPSTPTSQGVVTVRMWSTDYWDITASTSGWTERLLSSAVVSWRYAASRADRASPASTRSPVRGSTTLTRPSSKTTSPSRGGRLWASTSSSTAAVIAVSSTVTTGSRSSPPVK